MDVERGRTVKSWKPRRLGEGEGGREGGGKERKLEGEREEGREGGRGSEGRSKFRVQKCHVQTVLGARAEGTTYMYIHVHVHVHVHCICIH